MTTNIAHDANLARLDYLHELAAADREVKRALRRLEQTVAPVRHDTSVRPAGPADRPTLERLAALDSSAVPAGEVLIAEIDGEHVAAIEVATGSTIADPFRRTAAAVELLVSRAAHLREGTAPARRRLRLAYRAA